MKQKINIYDTKQLNFFNKKPIFVKQKTYIIETKNSDHLKKNL